MVRTNDGFEIAEVDLQIRGAGDIMGTKQSGDVELKLADLIQDGPILARAREAALGLIQDDPKIQKTGNRLMIPSLRRVMTKKSFWSKIS